MSRRALHVPHPEQVATSNAWAFLHWLRATGRANLEGWEGLIAWSAADPAGFSDALAGFAGLPLDSLSAPGGEEGRGEAGEAPALAWALRYPVQAFDVGPAGRIGPSRRSASVSAQRPSVDSPTSPRPSPPRGAERELRRTLETVRLHAEILLHADLRPDDRVLVMAGPPWPWLLALRYRTQVVLASPLPPPTLLSRVAEEQATILVADAGVLPDAAFQRPGRRLDLSRLRCVVALGGPLAPEARARVYTWLKSDVLLLARAGDRLWGSPLDPVPSRPGPPLSFFRPPPPVPAPA